MSKIQKTAARDPRVAVAIRELKPFETYGAFHGEDYVIGAYSSSWNYGSALNLYCSEIQSKLIDYVIYSFNTPIAWHVGGTVPQWRVMGRSYSSFTSKHQAVVRSALSTETRVLVLQRDLRLRLSRPQQEILSHFYAGREFQSVEFPRARSRTIESLRKIGLVNPITYGATPQRTSVWLTQRGREYVFDLTPNSFWNGRAARATVPSVVSETVSA